MPITNRLIWWIVAAILAYLYGLLVQYVLGYERNHVLKTLSIGAVGLIIGHYAPQSLNLSRYLYIGGIPIFTSLVGSFILPGIMWFLRGDRIRKSEDSGL